MNFADRKYSSEYKLYLNDLTIRRFVFFLISYFCFSSLDTIFNIAYGNYSDQLIHKIATYAIFSIGFILIFPLIRNYFFISLKVYILILLSVQTITIYIEQENNDVKLYFQLFFIMFFQFCFATKEFKFFVIISSLYFLSCIPAMYLNDWVFKEIDENDNFLYQNLPLLYGRNLLVLGLMMNLITYGYRNELNSKIAFIKYNKKVLDFKKSGEIFANLVPEIARDKMLKGERGATVDYQDVSIIFADISDFDSLMSRLKPREIISLLDKIYNTFDQLCDIHGLQKIETVGKTYMAAGGLQEYEKYLEPEMKMKQHSIRVFEMALDIVDVMQSVTLEKGELVKVKIGIHKGLVLSAVVGDHKPQFSLIGDAVNTTARMCANSKDMCIMCSEQAYEKIKVVYNENFTCSEKYVKGLGDIKLYLFDSNDGRNLDQNRLTRKETSDIVQRFKSHTKTMRGLRNKKSATEDERLIMETRRLMKQKSNASDNSNKIYENSFDDEQPQTIGLSKQLTKRSNYFVERQETGILNEEINTIWSKSFFFLYFKSQALENLYFEYNQQTYDLSCIKGSVLIYSFLLIIVFSNFNIYYTKDSAEHIFYFVYTKLALCALFLIVKLFGNYINKSHHKKIRWLYLIIFLFFTVILQFQTYFTEEFLYTNIMLEQKLVLIAFCFNGIFEFFQIFYGIIFHITFFIVTLIICHSNEFVVKYTSFLILISCSLIYVSVSQEYQSTLEFLKNKKANDDLQVNEDLLFNLMPPHVVQNLKEDIPVADELKNVTLLFSDIVGFTAYSKERTPKEVVNMVSELFEAFDNASKACNVYKVHTIGDCYVNLGYTGKVPERDRNYKEEALNVVKMGKRMIEIIQATREKVKFQELNMRIGIHTVNC